MFNGDRIIGVGSLLAMASLAGVALPAPLGQAIALPVAPVSPAFEVASIRPNASASGSHHIYSSPNDGQFRSVNAPLKMLLEFAYGIPESQIVGAPGWADSDKFDIEAKADSTVNDLMKSLTVAQGRLQKQLMLQALFADRFKLATHFETRQLPVYALVVAKGGAKFLAAPAHGTSIDYGTGRIHVQGGASTVALLAENLANAVGRPVLDKTGIEGRYDIALKWTPDDGPLPMLNGAPDTSAPSLFTAIQEQLGLKLEPQKGPVQVLVIDHIEPPSEN